MHTERGAHPQRARNTTFKTPATVLVAEDDEDILAAIVAVLRADGYNVVEAHDGGELLELISASLAHDGEIAPYDVIVSDIQMPGFTALEILAGLRRAVSHTPVILTTAYGDERVRERALRLGAREILDKPFELEELKTAIERALAA